jgi:predicted ribosome quality control (RQC) complex YloA/Tae2 family protein
MQQLNYYCLYRVTRFLTDNVLGGKFIGPFTQQKDELVLPMRGKKTIFLRVGCLNDFQYIVPELKFRRARTNTVNIFPDTAGAYIQAIELLPNDRILLIQLTHPEAYIVLKMHASRSNVLWLDATKKVVDQFRHQLTADQQFVLSTVENISLDAKISALFQTQTSKNSIDWKTALRTYFPGLDNLLLTELQNRLAVSAGPPETVKEFIQTLENGANYVSMGSWQESPAFFLLPQADLKPIADIGEALRLFLRYQFRWRRFGKLQQNLLKRIEKMEVLSQSRLQQAKQLIQKLEKKRSPEELGNLLLAHLHQLPLHAAEVEVTDWYQNGMPVKIPLEMECTVQQNAEKLFKQARSRKEKIQAAHYQIALNTERLARLTTAKQQLIAAQKPEQIAQLLVAYPELRQQQHDQEHEPTYREFNCRGYTILAGKDAESNDLLTMTIAKKNDVWLHAKDVTGAHVVIRRKMRDETIPAPVIEFAARLAAYFSKLRNETLVPVSMTARKFVRKSRKMAAGQVTIQNETVLLVEPLTKAEVFNTIAPTQQTKYTNT